MASNQTSGIQGTGVSSEENALGDGESRHLRTPGPWTFRSGGGHAYNSIRGSAIVQVNGWRERFGGVSNASYSDRVCENLGDPNLDGPAANIALICAAPELLEALKNLLRDEKLDDGDERLGRSRAQAALTIAKAEGRSDV